MDQILIPYAKRSWSFPICNIRCTMSLYLQPPGEFSTQTCFQGRFGEELGSDEFGGQIMVHQPEKDTQVRRANWIISFQEWVVFIVCNKYITYLYIFTIYYLVIFTFYFRAILWKVEITEKITIRKWTKYLDRSCLT